MGPLETAGVNGFFETINKCLNLVKRNHFIVLVQSKANPDVSLETKKSTQQVPKLVCLRENPPGPQHVCLREVQGKTKSFQIQSTPLNLNRKYTKILFKLHSDSDFHVFESCPN